MSLVIQAPNFPLLFRNTDSGVQLYGVVQQTTKRTVLTESTVAYLTLAGGVLSILTGGK